MAAPLRLLLLCAPAAVAACAAGGGLRSWLCAASIHLQRIELADVAGFSVSISGLRCSGFEAKHLSSSLSSSSSSDSSTTTTTTTITTSPHGLTGRGEADLARAVSANVSAWADGLSFNCTIQRLDAKQLGFPHLEPVGEGSLRVIDASLETGLLSRREGEEIVVNMSAATHLRINPARVDLTLQGNIWIKLINAIKPVLIGKVIEMLPSILTDLRRNVDDELAPLVANLTEYSQRPLPAEPPEPPLSGSLINLSEWEELKVVDYLLNDVMGADGPLGFNRLVDLLSNGTGALALDVSSLLGPISIPVPSLGNLSLSLQEVNGSSLASFSRLALLTPNTTEPLTLRLRAGMDGPSVGATARLTVTPGAGAISSFPLLERFGVEASLGALDVAAALMLALNTSAFTSTDPRELFDLPCLLSRAIVNASIRSLRLSILLKSVDVHPIREEELEDEVDQVIDHVADFMLLSFGDYVLPRALALVVAEPLRDAANDALQGSLLNFTAGAACPVLPPPVSPPPPPPPLGGDIIDWRESEALRLLNSVLSAVPRGVDALVDLITHKTGRLSLSLPAITASLGPFGMLHISLSDVTLGGLDSISELQLLKSSPYDGAALLAGAALGALSLESSVEAWVTRVRVDASNSRGQVGRVRRSSSPYVQESYEPGLGRSDTSPRLTRDARSLSKLGDDWLEASASQVALSGALTGASLHSPLKFTLRASFQNLTMGAAAQLLVNGTGLAALQVQQALSTNGSACLARQLVHAALTSLRAAMVVERVEVGGSTGVTPAVLHGTPLRLLLGRDIENAILNAINSRVALALQPLWDTACPPPIASREALVDFRGNRDGALAVARAHRAIDAFGAQGLNRFFDRFTSSQNPGEALLESLLDVRFVDEMLGPVRLVLKDVDVAGLDQFFELDALRPDAVDARLLHHSIAIGVNTSLALAMTMGVGFSKSPVHTFRVSAELSRSLLELDTRLLVDGGTLGATNMSELLASRGTCILCDIRSVSLEHNSTLLALPKGGFTFSIWPSQADARSSGAQHAARLTARTVNPQLHAVILSATNIGLDKFLRYAHRGCPGSPPSSPADPRPPDNLLGIGIALVSGTCLLLVLFGALGASACVRRRRSLGLRLSLRTSLLDGQSGSRVPCDPSGDAAESTRADSSRARGADTLRWWSVDRDSLSARFTGRLAQLGVPLLIACNVIVFIFGNALPGAEVVVTVTLAGDPVVLPTIKTFSLINTVRDMWRAQAYLLCVLIAFLSGVWPYIKLGLMLLAWWLPGTYLSARWRERMLRALDFLGKWSALDTLMLVVFTVAFHITYSLPSTPNNLRDTRLGALVSVALVTNATDAARPDVANALSEVVPGPGVYLFTSGVCLSLSISALLVRLQRIAMARGDAKVISDLQSRATQLAGNAEPIPDTDASVDVPHISAPSGGNVPGGRDSLGVDDSQAGAPEITRMTVDGVRPRTSSRRALCDRQFRHIFGRANVMLPRWLRVMMLVALCASGALLAVACTTYIFSLEVTGLAGQLLGPNEAKDSWSVVAIAELLPSASPTAGSTAMRLIQVLFVLFIIGLPILFLVALGVLWVVPLTTDEQQMVLFAAEVLYSWSAPDVFVLTIVASSIELDRFAHFILGNECDAVSQLANTFLADLVVDPSEGCAGIHVEILPGAAVFLLAVVLWNGMGTLVMHVANAAVPFGPKTAARRLGVRRALFTDLAH